MHEIRPEEPKRSGTHVPEVSAPNWRWTLRLVMCQYAATGLFLGILGRLSSSLSNGTRIASGITVSVSPQALGCARQSP